MSKFPPAPFPSHLPAPPVLSSNPSAMDPLLEKSPSRSSRSSHSSHTSQSSHALDTSFDQQNLSSDDSAPAHNTADRLAYLNLTSPSGLTYEDYDSQEAFSHSDSRPYKESSWTRTFQTIIRGRAMPLRPLIFSILWAILAVVSSYFTRLGYRAHLNNECRWWCTPLAIDGDALSYVGFALFLLTSFRVQEAYGRYMEAVRVWTSIAGTITSFTKYVLQAFPEGTFHRGDRERILAFLVAFPVSLKRELRGERDLRELKSVLSGPDLAKLQNADSMPSYCLYILSAYCLHAKAQESRLPQTFIVHLIRWIADLAGYADVCMQIKTMPAPYSYVTHLNTFLGLWLLFLPFALVETSGWATILIVAFISYGVLGVVANAAELEDPFGADYNDLPLGTLAQNIQVSVADLYRAANAEAEPVVCAVADEDLKSSHDYWLTELAKKI